MSGQAQIRSGGALLHPQWTVINTYPARRSRSPFAAMDINPRQTAVGGGKRIKANRVEFPPHKVRCPPWPLAVSVLSLRQQNLAHPTSVQVLPPTRSPIFQRYFFRMLFFVSRTFWRDLNLPNLPLLCCLWPAEFKQFVIHCQFLSS